MVPFFADDAVGGADHLAHLTAVALKADESGGPYGDAVEKCFRGTFEYTDGAGATAGIIDLGEGTIPADGAIGTGLEAGGAGSASGLATTRQTFVFALIEAGQQYLLGSGDQADDLLGTNADAATASLASGEFHPGESILPVGEGPVGAGPDAVSQAQTAVEAFLGAAVEHGGRSAGGVALVAEAAAAF